jgi:hypothetical protein
MRMRVYDAGVSLVNCHLSSGQGEGDSLKRHADYTEILRRGAYPPDGQSTDMEVSLGVERPDQALDRSGSSLPDVSSWSAEREVSSASQ